MEQFCIPHRCVTSHRRQRDVSMDASCTGAHAVPCHRLDWPAELDAHAARVLCQARCWANRRASPLQRPPPSNSLFRLSSSRVQCSRLVQGLLLRRHFPNPILNPLSAQLMQCIAINLENSASSPFPPVPIDVFSNIERKGLKTLQGPASVNVGLIGTAFALWRQYAVTASHFVI